MIRKLGTAFVISGALGIGYYLDRVLSKLKEASSLDAYLPITEVELAFLISLFILCLGLVLRFKDILAKKSLIEKDIEDLGTKDKEVKDLKSRLLDINILLDQAVQTRMDAILQSAVHDEVEKQLSSSSFTSPVDFEIETQADI